MADEEKKEQPEAGSPKASPEEKRAEEPGEAKAAMQPAAEATKQPTAAPKPAIKPPAKKPPPKPEPLDNEFTRRLRERFGSAVGESTLDRAQAIIVVDAGRILEVGRHLRDEEKFNLLEDLTAVDWYDRSPRFDVLLNLYSFEKNERVRIKTQVESSCPSLAGIWGAANWLERECFDMFGIQFNGHPDLRRILLPDEWNGHPLRKDYDILQQDKEWVRENLGIESGQ